jgi:hypothetical protein
VDVTELCEHLRAAGACRSLIERKVGLRGDHEDSLGAALAAAALGRDAYSAGAAAARQLDTLTIAKLDLRLRRIAAPSLRVYRRRRPPGLYAEANRQLDAEDSARGNESRTFVDASRDALSDPAREVRPPTPR